jgi:hypothetical protein
MPRSKGRKKPKPPSPPASPPPSKPQWWKRNWKRALAIGAFVVGAVGFASAIVTFLPRFAVDAPSPFDSLQPLSLPFTITNNSIIPLWDVQPYVGLCAVVFWGPKTGEVIWKGEHPCDGPLDVLFRNPNLFVRRFTTDEKLVVHIEDIIRPIIQRMNNDRRMKSAVISIVLEFQPWFIPWQTTKQFRFSTREEPDGKLSWVPEPLWQ